jgi:HlyD family secretion protein
MSQRSSRGLAFLVEDRGVQELEQLDSTLQIASAPRWAYLGGLLGTLTALAMFCWLYRVPIKVDGRGILLAKTTSDSDSLLQVTAPSAGRIRTVKAQIGSMIQSGDVLAEINRDDLRDQVRAVEVDLERLCKEDEALTRFEANEERSRLAALAKMEATLQTNLRHDTERLERHRRIVSGDRSLNRRGMLSDPDALKSQTDADAVESAIGTTQAKLQELAFSRFEEQTNREREKLKRTLAIHATELKRDLLVEQLERESKIVSPYSGKVVDLMLTPHAAVEKGAPTALLSPHKGEMPPMRAIVFVPAGRGKQIRAGDTVEVSPDTTKRQEHGFVRGTVEVVSEIPATEEAMMAELKHKSLVASFARQQEERVLLCIHVALRERPANQPYVGQVPANRLEWSSTLGSEQRVSIGTLCAASVVVERKPLLALAWPWVKHISGME